MKRRHFLGGTLAAGALTSRASAADLCGCSLFAQVPPMPAESAAWEPLSSGVKITGVKVFAVSLTPDSDRPYVFVKIETNKGVVGWGEGTLEGKAGAVIACIDDFKEFLIGKDPMQVEHHWQSMYVHSFYRAGPVMGSAISGIDQALWDIRGKVLGMPVYKLLGGPTDPRGVRGYYHVQAGTREQLQRVRETATQIGVTCFKSGIPGYYEWIDTHQKIESAIRRLQLMREGLGPDIDIGIDFHAKTSPAVASIIVKEVEPLKLLFIEEPCPPENVAAMAKIARRSTTPIATGERLVAHYGCQQLIEMGAVDILQTDINHVGGITALWKVGQMAALSGISMAPHACEGPIGGLATVHVDAATTNFLVQEICSGVEPRAAEKAWEEWLGFPAMRMVNGRFPLSEKPGLGFDMDEKALAKYPFGGTRPMARVFHADGSVAEW